MMNRVNKFVKVKYKQNLVYLLPVLGLWIIFLLWVLFVNKPNPNQLNVINYFNLTNDKFESDRVKMKDGTFVSKVKVMTWNLQGLMKKRLGVRTKAVLQIIERESPEIIFFQELIPSLYNDLSSELQKTYDNVNGTQHRYPTYFTGIFYRKAIFAVEDHEIIPYSNSVMDRTQLILKLTLLGNQKIHFALMTSHLESLPGFKLQRLEQLKQCFEMCVNFPKKYNVIFGGDLNLEEDEEKDITIPDVVRDLWVESGSLEACKYTWDTTLNQNEEIIEENQQPRTRYDRMYFRRSSPVTLKLEKFELLGKEQVEGTSHFPSDHWAIQSSFSISMSTNDID